MEAEVLLEETGAAGVITLNRPKALNALNLGMVREILPRLRAWAQDPAITRVILKGAGEKAFCAGGDVRWVYDVGLAGKAEEASHFFREEYVLNHYIGTFPKPFVSLIDGICMGGGFGLSSHAPYKVGGDKYLFAMPEVNIGLFPDVGGSHVLPRLPGHFGSFLALTGNRIRTAEGHACGLLSHTVPSAGIAALEAALIAGDDVEETLAAHHRDPGPSSYAEKAPFIAEMFAPKEIFGVLAQLEKAEAAGGAFAEFAGATLRDMRTKCPTSAAIAVEQMRRGLALDLGECLKMEMRIVTRVLAGPDFYEGVRAVLVDRDNAPKWQPARFEDLDGDAIAGHFAPIPHELELLAPGS